MRTKGFERPDDQVAVGLPAFFVHGGLGLFDKRKHLIGIPHEPVSGGREPKFSPAFEEFRPELGFEGLDLFGDTGLRVVQLGRGVGEVERPRDDAEGAQVTQFHGGPHRSSRYLPS